MEILVVFMIGLELIWNINIQVLLHVTCGGFLAINIFCGWAHNWNAIMKSSSSSLSSVLLYQSLDWSGTKIWCACFGSPFRYCCDCGCAFLVKHILVMCQILLQCLHWYFFAGQCGELPHLVHWFGFLLYDCCLYGCLCCCGCCGLVPLLGFGFLPTFFFLTGKLVWLCLNMLIWAPPSIFDVCCLMCLAVALLDSSFLAIYHTFAAGYCARSVFPSFTVLVINSLSDMKN